VNRWALVTGASRGLGRAIALALAERGAMLHLVADATLDEQPAMVKIDCENRLTLKRESVSERMGRDFNLQELHLSLISLTGNIDETDDEFTLSWKQ